MFLNQNISFLEISSKKQHKENLHTKIFIDNYL